MWTCSVRITTLALVFMIQCVKAFWNLKGTKYRIHTIDKNT